MSWVAVGVGAVTVISGVVKSSKAKKEKKKIAKEAANMKEVPLENIADQLKVSTVGAKARQEGQSALEATQMATLQEGGTRAIGVGAGRVAAGSQAVNKDIAVNLNEQQQYIDQVKAEDAGRIRDTKEERNKAKLAALSSQYNAANAAQQQGSAQIMDGISQAGSAYAGKATSAKGTGTGGTGTGAFSSKYGVSGSISDYKKK